MSQFNRMFYSEFFQKLTGNTPFDYQIEVARHLLEGKNIFLRAPTGAGKTWSVLVPFFFGGWANRPARVIYVLPLRTLAQGVYREARDAANKLGLPVEGQQDSHGRETVSPVVTLQTGEQPDDRFFDRGKIIITTYDQLLSGLLCGPYGLSDRLHNVNAAVVAGSLVIFDEFHLMEPHRAFLTAVAGLNLFRHFCQSVWMTATATEPLERTLRDALETTSIPADGPDMDRLLDSLPSVTQVARHVIVEARSLSPESVLEHHLARSLVLLNTVGRAQAMFEDLRKRIMARKLEISVVLLHSRFFREDRRAKEEKLRSLFGKNARGSSILVATQVVEAGLDISCEHLHTELCPMSALVQRAGRCARFPGEKGTVHVYPLPSDERAWLPYGDLQHEDPALTRTRTLLERIRGENLHPRVALEWVQEVHGPDDELTLREGWRPRLFDVLKRIEQNAILRDPKRVADVIRGENTDSVRVIIADEASRPETPGQREGVSLSRRSLYNLFRDGVQEVGWFWDGSEEDPWKPLRSREDLNRTYAVCLRPRVAAYDDQVGFQVGITGVRESPSRAEPKRPGYAPLHAESWADHAQRVAAQAQERMIREAYDDGLLRRGFQTRYGLNGEAILAAARTCALLHDLGKLQEGWQRWAERAQRSKNPNYQHDVPLAHTDFDPESPGDRERLRSIGISRPPHAPGSAYFGRAFLTELLSSVSDDARAYVASACTAAILAHHGGWWPQDFERHPPSLWSGWDGAVRAAAIGRVPAQEDLLNLKRYKMEKLLTATTGADGLAEWWPLVAYLTRTLRLSDQRATAEGAFHE